MTLTRLLLAATGGSGAFPSLMYQITTAPHGGWTQATRPNVIYASGYSYLGWINGSNGNVEFAGWNHATNTATSTTVLHAALEADIHAAPALAILPNGKLGVWYSKHDGPEVYQRISTNTVASDPALSGGFGSEATLHASLGGSGDYTYMQPVLVGSTVYLFYRDFITGTDSGKLAYSTSADNGATWAAQTILLARTGHWIYFWVHSDGSRVDVVATDGHPALEADVKTYHLYLESGSWKQSDGTGVGALPIAPSGATLAFTPSSGDSAWPWGVTVDGSGHPAVLEQVIYGDGTNSIRRVAWSGTAWGANEIVVVDADPSTIGDVVWSGTAGISPGAVLDMDDPDTAYVCEQVSGTFELIRRRTTDGGTTWTGTALSTGSTDDCRYPFSPAGAGFSVVTLRGTWVDYLTNSLAIEAYR